MEKRFSALAHELATRDRDLGPGLEDARQGARRLRAHAAGCIAEFAAAATSCWAPHLAEIEVGSVEPDEKHVDCIQFKVRRGRFEIVCVAKAKGKVTLVGPYKRGKSEKPCRDFALEGEAVLGTLEDLLVELITAASQR